MSAFYVDLSVNFGTPVQRQGACGNCYAFAATDAVNMVNRVAGKGYPILSAQHLTDCSKGYQNNNGCNGGWLYGSLEYQKSFGVYSYGTYPQNGQTFSNGTEQPCKNYTGATKYFIKQWYYFTGPGCASRINYLNQGYAISIAVFANNNWFMYYASGVLTGCPASNLVDHAVVLVGAYYDPNNLIGSFYKIKNSWGAFWGEKGYIRISLGGNVCLACQYGAFSSF